MFTDTVEVTVERPAGSRADVTIRFFPEYSAEHPLWFWFDRPDLAALQLPPGLADRLRRWSAYWNDTFHWDRGWPAEAPERWWTEEAAQLPRDVAVVLGSAFVVEVDGRYVRSTRSAESPEAAVAVHALIDAETDERQRIRADIDAGGRYDVVRGDDSLRARLESPRSEEPPVG